MTSAIVHTPFKGCDDGAVHPRQVGKGETVHGDLARAAIAGGFADRIGSGELQTADGDGIEKTAVEPGPDGEATLGEAGPAPVAAPTNKARKSAPAKK